MDTSAFEAALKADGFTEMLTRELPPGQSIPEHTHPYDARGLTVAGHFTVTSAAEVQQCPVGKFFALTAGTPHSEAAGPDGATLLIGRRQR